MASLNQTIICSAWCQMIAGLGDVVQGALTAKCAIIAEGIQSMVITIRNTDDFIRALRENEEFRDAARRELLTEDLLKLPGEFREFRASAEEFMSDSKEFRTGAEEFMSDSKEFRTGAEEFMSDSKEFRTGMEEFRASAEQRLDTLTNRVDDLRGHLLEEKMARRLRQRLGRELSLSRVRVVWAGGRYFQPQRRGEAFSDGVERALEEGQLTNDETDRLLDTDMIVHAPRMSDGATVYVAVEASGVIGVRDIDRARESANVLMKLYDAPAIPAVYGFDIATEQRERTQPDPDTGLEEVHIFIEPDRF